MSISMKMSWSNIQHIALSRGFHSIEKIQIRTIRRSSVTRKGGERGEGGEGDDGPQDHQADRRGRVEAEGPGGAEVGTVGALKFVK